MSTSRRRPRRKLTPEFKGEAVAMVAASGGQIAKVAREPGIHDSSLGNWVTIAREEGAGAPKAVVVDTASGPAGRKSCHMAKQLALRVEVGRGHASGIGHGREADDLAAFDQPGNPASDLRRRPRVRCAARRQPRGGESCRRAERRSLRRGRARR